VDNLDLETSLKPDVFERFVRQNKLEKDVSYGVTDVHRHEVEIPEKMEGNIRHALTLFDSKSLWIDPDCGLKTRTAEEAIQILTNMQLAVDRVRRELMCEPDSKKS
jgi:5-methyltetrahydropteroyltriglutamate--homocysteine methyltransferase